MEIGSLGPAGVMVETAGVPAEVRLTFEVEARRIRLRTQRHGVAEPKDAAVFRVKTGPVRSVLFGSDNAPELVGVPVGVADPKAVPTSLQGCGRVRGWGGLAPLSLERGAPRNAQQTGDGQYREEQSLARNPVGGPPNSGTPHNQDSRFPMRGFAEYRLMISRTDFILVEPGFGLHYKITIVRALAKTIKLRRRASHRSCLLRSDA
jgi:hypothetical protein